ARCGSIAVRRRRGLVQRRPRPARVIHCLKNLLDSFGALKSNQREISHGGSCPYSGRTIVLKAMLYATQMRATDRRAFFLSPRGRSWLTYSFNARARVRQSQRGCAANGFCSKAFLACLFRCIARPAVKRIRGTPRMHG